MSENAPDTRLIRRIERLEAANRRMKLAGLAVVIVVVAAVLMGQAAPQSRPTLPKVIEAELFVLRSEDGKIRGMWDVEPDGRTALVLRDKDGRDRAVLGDVGLKAPKTGATEIGDNG